MSKIQWTDETWNPVTGCEYASPGCKNCYAVMMTKRLESMGQEKYQGLLGKAHFNGVVKTHDDALMIPLRWKKPRMVFVNSMSDLFHESVPFGFIDRVFAVMALTPQHTYQILTKRPERMAEYLGAFFAHGKPLGMQLVRLGKWMRTRMLYPAQVGDDVEAASLYHRWPLPNVWLGTSCENQEMLELRWPFLRECQAAIHFLSCEPLLGDLDLTRIGTKVGGAYDDALNGRSYHTQGWEDYGYQPVDWVIVGGESGSKARPCNVDWIRSIVSQCQDASVPVFVKQLGENAFDSLDSIDGWKSRGVPMIHTMDRKAYITFRKRKGGNPGEWPEDLRVRQFPEAIS